MDIIAQILLITALMVFAAGEIHLYLRYWRRQRIIHARKPGRKGY